MMYIVDPIKKMVILKLPCQFFSNAGFFEVVHVRKYNKNLTAFVIGTP